MQNNHSLQHIKIVLQFRHQDVHYSDVYYYENWKEPKYPEKGDWESEVKVYPNSGITYSH